MPRDAEKIEVQPRGAVCCSGNKQKYLLGESFTKNVDLLPKR